MKKRFTEEQIVSILREAESGEKTVAELARQNWVSEPTIYGWRRKYGGMERAEVRRLRELEKENARLKRLLAERDVEIDVIKEFLKKVGPASERREAAAFMERRGISSRRACVLLGLSRRWRSYQSRRNQRDMVERLKELARRYPRFGYRRLYQMLLRQGMKINVKRVRRLCVVAGLKLPMKRRKKRGGSGVNPPVIAEYPNHVWAYDFVFDWCENGRQLKFLTVVDEFTRACLAIEVDHRLGARQVCEVLLGIMERCGVPQFVRSDNGPEFIARALQRMLAVKGVTCRHIDPGSPWQNGKNERFNGILRDECTEMETFHHRDHARALCQLFRRYYNQERPHSSLGYRTPVEFSRRQPMAAAGCVVSEATVPSPAAALGCRYVSVSQSM